MLPGRGGDNDGVGADDADQRAVDLDVEVDRPAQPGAAQDDVVEGVARGVGLGLGGVVERDVEHGALLDAVGAREQGVEAVAQALGRDLGEEGEAAHIDAEDARGVGHDGAGGAQHGAVAADADQQVGAGQVAGGALGVPGGGEPNVGDVGAEAVAQLDGEVAGGVELGVVVDAHLAQFGARPGRGRAIGHGAPSGRGATGARSQQRNSRLPAGPRSGRCDDAAATPATLAGPGQQQADRGGVPGGVADDAALVDVVAGQLELRLDEHDGVGAGRGAIGGGCQRGAGGDKGDVDGDQAGGRVEGREVADVGALHDDDAGVAAEGGGELAVADVDGVDAGRAAPAQAVAEAAGARPDVEADAAGDVDRPGVEGGGELLTAARDVGGGGAHAEVGGGREAQTGLGVAAVATADAARP